VSALNFFQRSIVELFLATLSQPSWEAENAIS
jgi:hypothetical protein